MSDAAILEKHRIDAYHTIARKNRLHFYANRVKNDQRHRHLYTKIKESELNRRDPEARKRLFALWLMHFLGKLGLRIALRWRLIQM